MPNLQTDAEKSFYAGIGHITQIELSEMEKGTNMEFAKLSPIDRKKYSPIWSMQRMVRLQDLYSSFKIEIEKNIIILETQQKISLIESYKRRANELKDHLSKDYNNFIDTGNVSGWCLTSTHEQLHFIGNLICILEDHNKKLTPLNQEDNTLPNNLPSTQDKIDDIKSLFIGLNAFNNEDDYLVAVKIVKAFFTNKPIELKTPLFVKNGNVKNLAFAMGEIWRSKKNCVITYDYLLFYKKTFSIFGSQKLDKKNVFSNNLYKYSISKT